MRKSELRKLIKEELKLLLLEKSYKNPQNQKMIEDSFPISTSDIIKSAKLAIKRRDASIEDYGLKKPKYSFYGNMANLSKTISVKLNDAGQSNVTPGGTLHSTRGITLAFHITGHWKEGKGTEYKINCSKTAPGGMAMYNPMIVRKKSDVMSYMKKIVNSNKPNTTQKGVY